MTERVQSDKTQLQVIRERVKLTTHHSKNIPDFHEKKVELAEFSREDWFKATEETVSKVKQLLDATRDATREIGSMQDNGVLLVLNADDRFDTHLEIMHAYVEVLCSERQFMRFLSELSLTPEFLHILVDIHDYGRAVFNAQMPLTYVDGVSGAIVKQNMPNFPDEYLHSIRWITGEKPLPADDADLHAHETIGLMLKAIDTVGKRTLQGDLIDPEKFFGEDGAYKQWVKAQEKNGRLPFKVVGTRRQSGENTREITAQAYAEADTSLTQRGLALIERHCGQKFETIRSMVDVYLPPAPLRN